MIERTQLKFRRDNKLLDVIRVQCEPEGANLSEFIVLFDLKLCRVT